MAGTTITAPPEVSADTLPFTGTGSGDYTRLGLLTLLAGGLMLYALRGPRTQRNEATDLGGWSSL